MAILLLAIGIVFASLVVAVMLKMAGTERDLDMETAEDRAFVEKLTALSFPTTVVWERVRFTSALDSILYAKFRIPRKDLDELFVEMPIQWKETSGGFMTTLSPGRWFDPETVEKPRYGEIDRSEGKNSYLQILHDDSSDPDDLDAEVTVYLIWFNT